MACQEMVIPFLSVGKTTIHLNSSRQNHLSQSSHTQSIISPRPDPDSLRQISSRLPWPTLLDPGNLRKSARAITMLARIRGYRQLGHR